MGEIYKAQSVSPQKIAGHFTEGDRGGPGSKFYFLLVSYHVIALVIFFPKWAHLSPNSQRRPRYDATKLGTTRAILAICIGKMGKMQEKNSTATGFLSHWGV